MFYFYYKRGIVVIDNTYEMRLFRSGTQLSLNIPLLLTILLLLIG